MNKIRYVFLLSCVFPLSLFAQKVLIKGSVSDSAGRPVGNVVVELLDSKSRLATAFTNDSGVYNIQSNTKGSELRFSLVGMNTLVERVNGRSEINVVMAGAANTLNDVVVVGYGTQKKVSVTGSISTVSGKALTVTKNENVMNMLTGKVPGLRMNQRTAEPGSYENAFDIRGYGGAPLVVIDGVPRSGIERMDPNEIESISVLKDASAAIYGVNGGNGVILITTKKGASKDGKFDINYSYNHALQKFLGMPQGVGPVDYMMLTNEKVKRDFDNNFTGNSAPQYSYDNIMPWVDGRLVGADWIGSAFNTIAPQDQHNINISGGTDRVNAFLNLGYLSQGGILKTNSLNYKRWNLRSNVGVKITDRLRAQLLLTAVLDEKNQPYQDLWTIFKYAWNQIPIKEIFANNNPDYLAVMPDNVNPVAVIDPNQVGYKKSKGRNIQAQGILEYEIPGIKGLKARGMYSYNYMVNDNTAFANMYNLYSFNAADSTYTASAVSPTGQSSPTLNRAYSTSYSTLTNLSLNYQNTFGGLHNVTGLVALEETHTKSDNIYAQRYMPIPMDYLFGGSADGQQGGTNSNGVLELATRSILGRAAYDYDKKYFVEFTFRRDGSNRFLGNKKWGFFPAVMAGWRINEEPFFQKIVSPDIVSNLKLRVSYGSTGTAADEASFQYLSGYTYPTVDPADNKTLGYMFNGQFITGAIARGLANPDLTWYTNQTANIGLDFTLLKGKIEGTVDVFRRDQKGRLAKRTAQLPGTVGVQLPYENLNSNRTVGVEGSLTYRGHIGPVGFTASGNASVTRTRNVTVIEGTQGNQYEQWRNGQTNRVTNIVWGTDYGGQYTNYDQIYNATINAGNGNSGVLPGDYYMQDWNGDGVIDGNDNHPIAVQDLPLVNYGFNISANYKGFDLMALFAGSAGVWTVYGEQLGQPLMYGGSALAKFLDSWHTVNPDDNVYDPNTQWIPGKYPSMGYNYGLIQNSTKGVVNASYLRLKTIEFGYSLPQSWLTRLKIKNLRLYVNAYNLLTFSGLDKGVDPEHPGPFPGASFDQSLGGYKYPLNKTYNFGGIITF